MLKQIGLILATLAPAAIIAFLTVVPSADVSASLPLFHFYVVTFTTFSAAVVSILLSATLIQDAESRHLLAAVAFAFIGSMFFSHGAATPGALIETFHPALRWSAWLTLFGGGAIFAVASLNLKRISLRWIVNISIGGLLIYWGIAAFGANYLDLIERQAAPWHRETIFYLSLFFWLFAAARFWWIARAAPNRVDTTLAMVAFWIAMAVISMHRYPLWKLSWWMYHIIMLIGFLITIVVLATEYERVRRFNLVRYYVAASLIMTALLALVASALFTQFSYDTAVSQIETAARNLSQNIASGIAAELQESNTSTLSKPSVADWKNIVAHRIGGLSAIDVSILDLEGKIVYSTQPKWIGVQGDMDEDIARTLKGQAVVEIFEPGNLPGLFQTNPLSKEPKNTYIIETYTPVRPSTAPAASPIGVLLTFQDAPELNQVSIRARAIGLITAFLTMGLLFFALLSVVRRADKVITTRTDELAVAYSNLRKAEAMRDDLTNMIAHDLRNPLTAITASIDLLNKPGLSAREDARASLINNARAASKRMTGLIDDLLTVGKIESGELNLNLETVALARLLAERVETFAAQAVAENKTLSFYCPPDLTIIADANLMGRVMDNLIGNAFKYVDSGDGKIHVTGRSDDGKIFMSVRDNGTGVPDDFKEKIFEKFAQAPNAKERATRKGTGLGLAFCRLVVELHSGKIWVQDTPEGGSEFILWIPLR